MEEGANVQTIHLMINGYNSSRICNLRGFANALPAIWGLERTILEEPRVSALVLRENRRKKILPQFARAR